MAVLNGAWYQSVRTQPKRFYIAIREGREHGQGRSELRLSCVRIVKWLNFRILFIEFCSKHVIGACFFTG